jgi:hypothetical protein
MEAVKASDQSCDAGGAFCFHRHASGAEKIIRTVTGFVA